MSELATKYVALKTILDAAQRRREAVTIGWEGSIRRTILDALDELGQVAALREQLRVMEQHHEARLRQLTPDYDDLKREVEEWRAESLANERTKQSLAEQVEAANASSDVLREQLRVATEAFERIVTINPAAPYTGNSKSPAEWMQSEASAALSKLREDK